MEAVLTDILERTGDELVGRQAIEARERTIRRYLEVAAPALGSKDKERIGELELLLEQAQKDPTSIERATEFASGFEKGANQERQRIQEALEKAFDTHARWAQEDAEAHRVRGRNEAALLASERERTYRVLVTSVGDILDGKQPLRALLDTLDPSGEGSS